MSAARRPQAPRLARPAARYWKGKAPKGAAAVADDSDEDEDADAAPDAPADEGAVSVSGEQAFAGAGEDGDEDEDEDGGLARPAQAPRRGLNVALRDVNISRDGRVVVAGREESGRTAAEAEEESEEDEEDAAASEEDESSEEESESEDEEKPKLMFRPVFVPKRARVTVAEREAEAQDTEDALKRKEAAVAERKQQSHDMVAETIRRELAEKEKEEETPDLDDTDGLDPAGEFEAWRLRELARIKRDKEDAVAREAERAEVERRRALPEAQRLAEDLAHAAQTRADKPKGQQKFLQKYWHKGAFHQDEEILTRHDFTEATESTVDVSVLPQVMQVRNFGKRSRTKYTHLLDQDTTGKNGGFGGAGAVKAGGTSTAGGGCFLCGGPHMKKDCPQNQDLPPGQRPTTGANGVGVGLADGARGRWDRDARGGGPDGKPRNDHFDQLGPAGRERLEYGRGADREPGRSERSWRGDAPERARSPPRKERWRDSDDAPRRRRSVSRSPSRERRGGADEKRRRLD